MLTAAQLTTLKAAIAAENDPTFAGYRSAGSTGLMADWFNQPSTFVVWKTRVAIGDVGKAFNGAELAGLTTGNQSRLQTLAQYLSEGVDPSNATIRQFFDDVFGGAGGQNTRAALLALWKKFCTRGEKVFATGVGTDASPATMTFQGMISDYDVVQALA